MPLMTTPDYKNKIRRHLEEKRQFTGAALVFGSTRASEVMAAAGFDFLMVDLQHGHYDKATATDSIRAIAASQTVPFARVSQNAPGSINDLLDAGALGIIVPMVNSAQEAAAAVKAAFYPPLGSRSKGGTAPILHGEDYAKWANSEIILTVMIETAEAVAKVDEILSVPGVGLCLIGTSDLAFEMRVARDGPEIRDALKTVAAAGKRHGVPVGSALGAPDDAIALAELDLAFYLISHDYGVLKDAAHKLASDLAGKINR
jgi:4-hydroxy-2-oxoheptanedioate aldolase